MTPDEWRHHVGCEVEFTYHHGERSFGIITSVNDWYVFVRFHGKIHPESCEPSMLKHC